MKSKAKRSLLALSILSFSLSANGGELSFYDKCAVVGYLNGSNNEFIAAIAMRMMNMELFSTKECNLNYRLGYKYGKDFATTGSFTDDDALKISNNAGDFSEKVYTFIISGAFKNGWDD